MRRSKLDPTAAILQLLVGCALVACATCSEARGGDLAGQASERLYAGEPLAVWEARAASVDPKSDYAATLVAPLVEIVQDTAVPGPQRGRLAVTLGRIGKPAASAVPALARILGDSSEPMSNRIWAGRALGLMGPHASPAANVLIDFLFDERVPVGLRQLPVEALAMIGSRHPDVLPALVELFQYSPEGDSGLNPGDVTALRELAAEAFAILKMDADVAVPLLSRAIRDPTEPECIRRKSLVALGKIGPAAAIAGPAILESLEFDLSEAARDEAALALARIGGQSHTIMVHYFSHPEASVRWRVAWAMREIKSPRPPMLSALQNAASDPHELVRLTAVETLAERKTDRATFLTPAIQLLASDDRQIRMRAMRLVLAQQPLDANETADIERLVNHENAATARIARFTLQKLKAAASQ